ncbi:hypothetical protein ACFPTY_20150 [Halomonas beimenensis]|uniref:hypothetical protein n=1 Tax=Halomonas beimenensis TaxID=475662 RepID=UPI00361D7127
MAVSAELRPLLFEASLLALKALALAGEILFPHRLRRILDIKQSKPGSLCSNSLAKASIVCRVDSSRSRPGWPSPAWAFNRPQGPPPRTHPAGSAVALLFAFLFGQDSQPALQLFDLFGNVARRISAWAALFSGTQVALLPFQFFPKRFANLLHGHIAILGEQQLTIGAVLHRALQISVGSPNFTLETAGILIQLFKVLHDMFQGFILLVVTPDRSGSLLTDVSQGVGKSLPKSGKILLAP